MGVQAACLILAGGLCASVLAARADAQTYDNAGNFVTAPPLRGDDNAAVSDPTDPAIPDGANFGKRKQRRQILPKHYGPAYVAPLPPLQPYRTAPGVISRNPAQVAPAAGPTTAMLPAALPRRKPVPETNPYDPLGLRLGNLVVKPYVESDVGYDSNPFGQPSQPQGSWFLRGEAGGTIQSDWSRDEFDATVKSGYDRYLQLPANSSPDNSVTANGRIDVSRALTIDAQGRFVQGSQQANAPGLLAGVNLQSRPLTYNYGATLGATQTFNRVALGLHGSIDRYSYDNANIAGGGIIDLANGNYTDSGLQLRAGYDLLPGVAPFVEVDADRRLRDVALDTAGYARNSTGYGAKLGSTFSLSQLLTGSISTGLAHRVYKDVRLGAVTAPTLDANLVWTPTPLTTVTLHGTTDIAESTVTGATAALTHTVTLQVAHQLLRNLTLTGSTGWTNTSYAGAGLVTNQLSAGLSADYSLTREIKLHGAFTRQSLTSNQPGYQYTDNVFLFGVRLQR
ncbi:MAG: outer membrane beta-barrel protein [Hyphomicrobiales bacterium]|nr:outer membrane beta-barrel protein [Hyphomicrobiales bacterium]